MNVHQWVPDQLNSCCRMNQTNRSHTLMDSWGESRCEKLREKKRPQLRFPVRWDLCGAANPAHYINLLLTFASRCIEEGFHFLIQPNPIHIFSFTQHVARQGLRTLRLLLYCGSDRNEGSMNLLFCSPDQRGCPCLHGSVCRTSAGRHTPPCKYHFRELNMTS